MSKYALYFVLVVILSNLVSACGGSSSSSSSSSSELSNASELTLAYFQVKKFEFTWDDVDGATYYKLLENPDGSSGFSQVGDSIEAGVGKTSLVVSLHQRFNAEYILQSCNSTTCIDSDTIIVSSTLIDSIGYVKASNTDKLDYFGISLSLSGDGNTMAVGAIFEDSASTGINGIESDNSKSQSGAVYVFVLNNGNWSQEAYIKPTYTDYSDYFGYFVSLNSDGSTLAIGTMNEDSAATGINGNGNDNLATNSGAVYIYEKTDGNWAQQAYIKASNAEENDEFGPLSLSGDGSTLAVGASLEDSNATGIDGLETDNSKSNAGAVYVFSRINNVWSQQAYIKASNTDSLDRFGTTVSLSNDGSVLAVGAPYEDSSATGVNGIDGDNTVVNSGAVYVFRLSDSVWSQDAYIKSYNTDENDRFASHVNLSGDALTLAVGSFREDSSSSGIDGDSSDNSETDSGAIYIYTFDSDNWSYQAYIKASNSGSNDFFGADFQLSYDGTLLVVGAMYESGDTSGFNGNNNDNLVSSGAAYLFSKSGTTWRQDAYIKSKKPNRTDHFGKIAISNDGDTLAVSAYSETSSATGISGYDDDTVYASGAVYLY